MYIYFALVTLCFLILIPFLISGISGAVFLPTNHRLISEAVKLADIKKSDNVIDLGSGDGRFLFEAAKYSEHVFGVEIHPLLVLFTRLKIYLGRNKNIKILFKNFWHINLKEYDVIFTFLHTKRMKKLEDKIRREGKRQTRIITYAFRLPNLKWVKKTKDGLYLYILK